MMLVKGLIGTLVIVIISFLGGIWLCNDRLYTKEDGIACGILLAVVYGMPTFLYTIFGALGLL